jgi:hypothetical protein
MKEPKLYAKNADYYKFENYDPPTDYHGLVWSERAILEVITIDYDFNKALVKNCNGSEWIMDLKYITFCYQNGDRIK